MKPCTMAVSAPFCSLLPACRLPTKQGPRSLEPLPPVPVAFLAPTPRLVLVMHNLHLDVWKIPKHPVASTLDRLDKLDGDENDGPQLVLRVVPKSEKGGHMSCAALAPNG